MSLLNENDLVLQSLMRGERRWGNIPLNYAAVEERGLGNALAEEEDESERHPLSGQSSEMTRKQRREHYVEKGIMERRKEESRRRTWLRRHPGAPESNWVAREERRKTRKVARREARRILRRRRKTSHRK